MAWNDPRPMSPHLQIYRLPLTAKLSILHRITGAFLALGFLLLLIGLWVLNGGEEQWTQFAQLINGILFKIFIVALLFSLNYHLCNGVRHLIWDFGYGLAKQEAQKSAYIVIAFSLLLTLLNLLGIFL